jgi:hypothetical protein
MRHGSQGEVLDVGRRRRTVPPAIRRALDHRDGGCRFPGCDCRYTDAHHITHWADGGETKLDNLVLLCARNHRAVHEEGFRVEVVAGSGRVFAVRFYRPDGRLIPEVPDSPVLSSDPVATLVRANLHEGVQPDPWTPTPRWNGDTPDVGLALDMLRHPLARERQGQGGAIIPPRGGSERQLEGS